MEGKGLFWKDYSLCASICESICVYSTVYGEQVSGLVRNVAIKCLATVLIIQVVLQM